MAFEPPSFSLGLNDTQVPSFSLGIDEIFPGTPSPICEDVGRENGDASGYREEADFGNTSGRRLKRLRRGPSKSDFCEKTSCSPPTAAAFDPSAADEIEEFSSDEEQHQRSHSQAYNSRSYSTLKSIRTPPVFEKGREEMLLPSPLRSRVAITKTSLGSKEVRFQGTYSTPPSRFSTVDSEKASTSSRAEKVRTPLVEFRDNKVFIDLDGDDDDDEEQGTSFGFSTEDPTAQLVRERFPHFLSVCDIEQGKSGEPVYIDYRGQFGENGAAKVSAASRNGNFSQVQSPPKPKDNNKRKKNSSKKSKENTSSGPRGGQGYWLTAGGKRVYVTAGQRLVGREAYKRYLKDTGKSFKKTRKSGKKQLKYKKKKQKKLDKK